MKFKFLYHGHWRGSSYGRGHGNCWALVACNPGPKRKSNQHLISNHENKCYNIAKHTCVKNITQIITHDKKYFRGEMKYMSDYKNQAWSLKLEKSSVRTISLCPLLGDHLFHLVHLPVVLLIHHHLNDNHHLPNGPTTYIVANMITAPIFPAALAPPCRPPW